MSLRPQTNILPIYVTCSEMAQPLGGQTLTIWPRAKFGCSAGAIVVFARGEYEQKVVGFMEMFHQITVATPKYIENLCHQVLQTENNLMIKSSSSYRAPLFKSSSPPCLAVLLVRHALEARPFVRQALDVLTAPMPLRMEYANTMLTHWMKKIIVEEGHSMQQLFHIVQLMTKERDEMGNHE
uniref:Uncharacterized protein n=1 Tax=Glossina palpalis gambiensis TaxID=67801 RepID=A0A1B0BU13_9MUSC